MIGDRRLYVGPALRRVRRELGLTQSDMAADLEVSSSYIALLERNHRPMSAEVLLRLAQTYDIDLSSLTHRGDEENARLQAALSDPIFAGIDLPSVEVLDLSTNFPGVSEALLRLHAAYQDAQTALADRSAQAALGGEDGAGDNPAEEAARFLAARRNSFPDLDDAAERLSQTMAEEGGPSAYLVARHGLRVRLFAPKVMVGATCRLSLHNKTVALDETLDAATRNFQLALQIAYLDLKVEIEAAHAGAAFATDTAGLLVHTALGRYAAAALLMPYSTFVRAAEARRYDIEALGRQFAASFEQVAHRLTTLQKPGQAGAPFFFIRVDAAGNVSKRLDGAGFPFARHGGGCPLWSVHQAFRSPRRILTQWLELPDGQRFFSIARTVTAGGGAYGQASVERAVALGCAAEHAHRLIYADPAAGAAEPAVTPIGVTCRLCQRSECMARSAPPIGRQIQPEDFRRSRAPFAIADA